MAFGSKASAGANSFVSENGGNGKDIFFPTASGKNGATATYTLRLLADEDEVVYREWASNDIVVNGQKVFRSCVVGSDNPIDNANRAKMEEIKAQGLSEEETKEAIKALNLKWTKAVFAINVVNVDARKVQVLKGSWERHIVDEDNDGMLVPAGKIGAGRSLYAKLLSTVQLGVTVADTSGTQQKGKAPRRITITDPSQFDIELVCKGQGQMGKSYEFRSGFYSPDTATLDDELLSMSRYDLEAWAKGDGVWSNEAIEELLTGADYYQTVQKYGIKLYPELRKGEVTETVSAAEEETEEALF